MSDHKLVINRSRINLLMDKARDCLENIFCQRWTVYKTFSSPTGNISWQNDATHGTQLAALCTKIPNYQKSRINAGDLSDWDVTLLYYAFTELSNYIRRSLTSATINNADDTLAKDGKDLRNDLNHQPKLSMLSDADFATFLNKFEQFFLAAGFSQFQWDELKNQIMSYGQSYFEMDIKFAELDNKADECIKDNKYKEALEVYNEILQLKDLSREKKSAAYANRSAICLFLKDKKYFMEAKKDAENAIELRPSWWRGYFALGKALVKLNQLPDAEKAFINAHTLDDSLKEITDELYNLRREIGVFSRYDHFDPDFQRLCQTPEEYATEILRKNNLDPTLFNEAMKTHPLADVIRGDQFRDGNGVQQDFTEALHLYTKAADNEIPWGMLRLGQLYEEGKGVNKDYDQMMHWYKKAAECEDGLPGVAEAQHCLGIVYLDGINVSRNYYKAAEWFEKASSNEYLPATNDLGVLYLNGTGVLKSVEKAFSLFKKAAEKGNTGAMINLSSYYFSAHGESPYLTTADIDEGKKWLKRAAENGNKLAEKELEEFKSMSLIDLMMLPLANLGKSNFTTRVHPLDQQFREHVEEAALKGSITAKQHIEIWDNMRLATEAFKEEEHYKACENMSLAIRLNYQIVKIPNIMESSVKNMAERYPDNKHIITCLIQLDNALIEKHFDNFKDDEHFQLMKIVYLIKSKRTVDAILYASDCVKRNSNNFWFLYLYAVASEEIPLLDAFLEAAPADHFKIPGIHYRKADLFFLSEVNIPAFIKSYGEGLESEKSQLDCFLPYENHLKNLWEKIYYELHKNPQQIPAIRQKITDTFAQSRLEKNEKKCDPKKQKILTYHRKCFIEGNPAFLQTTRKSPPRQPRSFINLKKIVLKDIYQSQPQSQPLLGHILEARIIDWAVGSPNTLIVIEDENGGTARVLICNCKLPNHVQLMKHFCPNSIITINGPLMEQDDDGQSYILVESPAHFHLDSTDTQKHCYICNKEGHMFTCSRCRMTLYCSKECQKLDWEDFSHKSVCKYLKNLAADYESLKN